MCSFRRRASTLASELSRSTSTGDRLRPLSFGFSESSNWPSAAPIPSPSFITLNLPSTPTPLSNRCGSWRGTYNDLRPSFPSTARLKRPSLVVESVLVAQHENPHEPTDMSYGLFWGGQLFTYLEHLRLYVHILDLQTLSEDADVFRLLAGAAPPEPRTLRLEILSRYPKFWAGSSVGVDSSAPCRGPKLSFSTPFPSTFLVLPSLTSLLFLARPRLKKWASPRLACSPYCKPPLARSLVKPRVSPSPLPSAPSSPLVQSPPPTPRTRSFSVSRSRSHAPFSSNSSSRPPSNPRFVRRICLFLFPNSSLLRSLPQPRSPTPHPLSPGPGCFSRPSFTRTHFCVPSLLPLPSPARSSPSPFIHHLALSTFLLTSLSSR